MKKGILGAIISGVVILMALVIFFSGMKRVPAGYAGVVYSYSQGVTGETIGQGWHFVGFLKELTLYSIGIEQSYLTSGSDGDSPHDDSFEVPSSDSKGLMVDLTFTYRFDADRIAEIFTRFKGRNGKEVRDEFIKPNCISWVKEVTAKYPVTEILGDERANLNIALSEYIKDKFEPYGIIIENVSLINIDVDEETKASVQRKVNAQQELELAQIEQKTANVQAQKDKEVALIKAEQDKETAQIAAEQAKIKAEGEAEATRIRAEAEANANALIAASITDELNEYIKVNQWNGEQPLVVGSGATIIDMGSLSKPDETEG